MKKYVAAELKQCLSLAQSLRFAGAAVHAPINSVIRTIAGPAAPAIADTAACTVADTVVDAVARTIVGNVTCAIADTSTRTIAGAIARAIARRQWLVGVDRGGLRLMGCGTGYRGA